MAGWNVNGQWPMHPMMQGPYYYPPAHMMYSSPPPNMVAPPLPREPPPARPPLPPGPAFAPRYNSAAVRFTRPPPSETDPYHRPATAPAAASWPRGPPRLPNANGAAMRQHPPRHPLNHPRMQRKRKGADDSTAAKRFKMPTNWNQLDAERAQAAEAHYEGSAGVTLMVTFPDFELSSEIVQNVHPALRSVYFPVPCAPRICYVKVAEGYDIEEVKRSIEATYFELKSQPTPTVTMFEKRHAEKNSHLGDTIDPFTIFLGNLPQNIHIQDIKNVISWATRIDLGKSLKTKKSRYALLRFETVENSIEALKIGKKAQFGGRTAICRFQRFKMPNSSDSGSAPLAITAPPAATPPPLRAIEGRSTDSPAPSQPPNPTPARVGGDLVDDAEIDHTVANIKEERPESEYGIEQFPRMLMAVEDPATYRGPVIESDVDDSEDEMPYHPPPLPMMMYPPYEDDEDEEEEDDFPDPEEIRRLEAIAVAKMRPLQIPIMEEIKTEPASEGEDDQDYLQYDTNSTR